MYAKFYIKPKTQGDPLINKLYSDYPCSASESVRDEMTYVCKAIPSKTEVTQQELYFKWFNILIDLNDPNALNELIIPVISGEQPLELIVEYGAKNKNTKNEYPLFRE